MTSGHSESVTPHITARSAEGLSLNPDDRETRTQPSDSAFIRLTLVGSALLGAVALLPYAILRRQFISLERRLEHATIANDALQRDMQKLLEQDIVRRGEYKQLGGLISEAKHSMEEVRRAGERREAEQRTLDGKLLGGIQELKTVVERTETAAVERHLAGTEWMRDILDRFRWSGKK
ncbi:uncharacterized protein B0H18DRAFT_1099944 [Fomitopsis serialis]|uniref:uncharacterized protein n=1 Tax=Fomitopsis serialis TaxID=139415 RepID=UPI0020084344|nr:uncharacterized protein B0H18DRAFT_1099944 [Neoantrodia serialis]KAH9938064.1 hypothetical protein B0H18DRAFT_1099944 [Neoantrodia serialis]